MNLHINNDLNYPSPFCEPNASSFGINKRGNFSFSFLVVFFFPQSPSFLSSSLPPPAPPLSFRKTTVGHKFLNQCSRSPAAEQCRPSWEVTCHVPNLPGMTAAPGWKKSFPLASVLLQGHLADQWPSSPRFNALCSTPSVAMTAVHLPLQRMVTTTKEYRACDQEFGGHWLCWLCHFADLSPWAVTPSLCTSYHALLLEAFWFPFVWPILCGFFF